MPYRPPFQAREHEQCRPLSLGRIGWTIGLGVVLVAGSPLITVATLISIYRHPALIAYKRLGRNEFCTTLSRRAGTREMVQATTRLTEYGHQRSFIKV